MQRSLSESLLCMTTLQNYVLAFLGGSESAGVFDSANESVPNTWE